MTDELTAAYGDLLDGTYDCVDRIVLNADDPLCHSAGGFRTWWRRLTGSDADLDTAHLMRLAGRFSRRVRAFASANGIPVIDCGKGERKHEIAAAYLEEHLDARGLFLILASFFAHAVQSGLPDVLPTTRCGGRQTSRYPTSRHVRNTSLADYIRSGPRPRTDVVH